MAQLNSLLVTGDSRFLNRIHGDITGDAHTVDSHEVPSSGNASNTQIVLGNDTRLTDSRTPTSHTHGKIDNDGKITTTLQSSDITIANGDKLIVTDESDTKRVVRTSATFDGSTTTKALTPKGTFETFATSSDLGDKMDKVDPTGSGSFSLNRKASTTVGTNSVAIGSNATASGNVSYAEGVSTVASAPCSHAEGNSTSVNGKWSHVEGNHTIAEGYCQHVSGEYNIADTNDDYAEIVGNGSDDNNRSNARTLDWSGNETISGEMTATYFNGTSTTGAGIIRGVMDNTTSTSTAFVVSAPGLKALYDGATIICKNTKVASASGCTLNVNGLGAKTLWATFQNAQVTTGFALNKTYLFVFDYTNDRWDMYEGRDNNDNDTYTINNYYSHPTAGGNGIKQYSLFARLKDGTYSSFFTTAGGTGTKTFDTTTEFDLTKVFHANIGSDIASGSKMTSNGVWRESCINIDMRYNFNGVTTSASTSSLQADLPVYLVVTETSSGYFKLVSPYITQDPTSVSADYLYVLIGYMRNSYNMDLHVHTNVYILTAYVIDDNPPVYEYRPYVNFKIKRAESNISTLTTRVNNKLDSANPTGTGDITLTGGAYLENNIHFDHCTTPASPSAYPVTMPEPGIMWKEEGYGDKFEIKPRFYGADDQNMLLFNAANGAAGTDPDVETIAKLHAKTASVDLIGTVPVINLFTNTTDLTQANNGVSGNTYVGTYYQDANGKSMAKITGVAYTDGKTGIELYAKNWNTSGTDQGNNTLTLYTDKDGSKTVRVTAPQAWLDALTRTTPATVAPNVFNIIGRDSVTDNNIRWFFINCASSLNGFKLVIELPANNWVKYRIETIGTANFGLFHNELYVGTNGSAAIDQCGYRDLNGTFTTVSGCSAVPTTYLTWTADKSNRKLTSNMIPKYGMCMVTVQSSTAITNLVKITTVDSN